MKTILFLCLLCSTSFAQLTGPAPVIDTITYQYPESFVIDLANYTLEQKAAVDSAKSAIAQFQKIVKEHHEKAQRDSNIIAQQQVAIAALNKALEKSEENDSLRKEQIEAAKPSFIDRVGSFLLGNAVTFIIVFGAILLVRKADPFLMR